MAHALTSRLLPKNKPPTCLHCLLSKPRSMISRVLQRHSLLLSRSLSLACSRLWWGARTSLNHLYHISVFGLCTETGQGFIFSGSFERITDHAALLPDSVFSSYTTYNLRTNMVTIFLLIIFKRGWSLCLFYNTPEVSRIYQLMETYLPNQRAPPQSGQRSSSIYIRPTKSSLCSLVIRMVQPSSNNAWRKLKPQSCLFPGPFFLARVLSGGRSFLHFLSTHLCMQRQISIEPIV